MKPGIVNSLVTRVLEYVGPRPLNTGTTYADGMERQLAIPNVSQTRWLLEDLEWAIHAADSGQMRAPARLCRSLRRDGVVHGVLSTRTEGLIQLPVKFAGDPDIVAGLDEDFRTVFPSAELGLIAGDGILLGVGVGEFVQIPGARPVLRRLDPEYLWYRWSEDRWYYQSIHGMLPINPGDGRWVLHFPGGTVQPWTNGLWMALGRAYIAKEHAFFYRENYSSKLANAARVAVSPQGATEQQKQSWFQQVMGWGVNTVFGMTPGYDVKLLESNGRGYEVYKETIDACNEEIIITLAGQVVTTTGGTGFTNANVFSAIRSDLIQSNADSLAGTINTQGIPVWADERYGSGAPAATCAWDVTPPKDQGATAQAMLAIANAIKAYNEAVQSYGREVDVEDISRRYSVPLRDLTRAIGANDGAGTSPPLPKIEEAA